MGSKTRNQVCRYIATLVLQILLVGNNSYAAFWEVDMSSQRGLVTEGRIFKSDNADLYRFLNQVPAETSGQFLKIDLPMPNGSLAGYEIYESSIMEDKLASKFPEIRSFIVRGILHPGSTGRVDISQKGFRGMIDTPFGRIFIDPLDNTSSRYVSRASRSSSLHPGHFQCGVGELEHGPLSGKLFTPQIANRIPGALLTYRLAVSATPEYVAAVSTTIPSISEAMAEINTAINRVNQIYERDLGIRFFLVADNDQLIDISGAAGFANNDSLALLDQNQAWIDSTIGESSYDIGHILSTGAGGIAQLESVCSPVKAKGVSGIPDPVGEVFYIDFIAHEIGHQFGANHTFNGSTGSCGGGNRNSATAFEPGSGSTIMSYAGICGAENLQLNSDATFHAGTIAEINSFVSNSSTGGSCATTFAITPSNNDPTGANAGDDKVIPANTAFSLAGTAIDIDGDMLSYQWDQLDAGVLETTELSFNSDQGNNPLFRSYVPQSTPVRHFPTLENLMGLTSVAGEVMPLLSRALNFRLTVRDCKSGQSTDDVTITVDAGSGPFSVTSHSTSTSFPATSSPTISWNVANTINPPVNCANVDIDLLSFSADKSTYAVINLVSATPNDGSEQVTITDSAAPVARFRVSCSDNVFYDISDADLNLTGSGAFPTTGNTTALSSAGICGEINLEDPENIPTIVNNDSATTPEATPIDIDVLVNDFDIDSTKSAVASVTINQGTNGTVTINADGTVKYTPATNFSGQATFTYTNTEGNSATVTVTVTAMNESGNEDTDPPVDDTDTTVVDSEPTGSDDGSGGSGSLNWLFLLWDLSLALYCYVYFKLRVRKNFYISS